MKDTVKYNKKNIEVISKQELQAHRFYINKNISPPKTPIRIKFNY